MSSIERRPTAGTWSPNKKKVIKYTPDFRVYINGDTSLPGCIKCGGSIDLMKYITSVSVESGVDPSGASGTISASIPLHTSDQFDKDSRYLLRTGLEVHIYMSGYFPISGQFSHVQPEETGGVDVRDVLTYPYYHTFHGVVTSVDRSESGGFQTVSMSCASMLHFWQYHNMSTNASIFGARPTNSGLQSNLVGHNYNKKTPYEIIHTIFHDTAGAAGGVGFALKDKTNISARSDTLDKSLWSMNIEYWKKRFSTKMMNLRMHGASGELFNTVQSAYLGRLSGSSLETVAKSNFAKFSQKNSQNRTGTKSIFGLSKFLGLIREVKDPATGETRLRADSTLFGTASAGMELNVATMQAYVEDLGQIGQVNFWESTYESKLDIINQVCTVTGFEFYQDVDGDMVFKPPLYNLDTSTSRIYRIEDIDIIDINFGDKEPEVTYITIKGGHFTNQGGTGLEGEWGVRAQYFDFRLVAQYGLRPGSLETAYFSNPRSMFYASVNRLDVMNASMHSATCTIPLRPELRPGYPVYFPSMDCFYYLTGFSHTSTFGSQCSTSLVLTARRTKFMAPGDPQLTGIEAIRLFDTNLPERPLEILDEMGRPRLSGFPNVVLALDTSAVNPLYFSVGADLSDLSNPNVVKNLIKIALDLKVIKVETSSDGANELTGPFRMDISDSSYELLDPINKEAIDGGALGAGDLGASGTRSVRIAFSNIGATALNYKKFQQSALLLAASETAVLQDQTLERELSTGVERQKEVVRAFQDELVRLKGSSKDVIEGIKNVIGREKASLAQLENSLKQAKQRLVDSGDVLNSKGEAQTEYKRQLQDGDVLKLKLLVDRVIDESGGVPTKTQTLLDLLSDKKAAFGNGSTPGSYVYYSASHPNPKYQGQAPIRWSKAGLANVEDAQPEKLLSDVSVTGYLPFPSKPGPDGELPESELGLIKVTNGIRILRRGGDIVVPTSEIQSLSFAKHHSEADGSRYLFFEGDIFTGVNEEYKEFVRSVFSKHIGENQSRSGSPIAEAYSEPWVYLTERKESFQIDGEGVEIGLPDEFAIFPPEITHNGVKYTTALHTPSDFKRIVFGDAAPVTAAFDQIVKILASTIIRRVNKYLQDQWEVIVSLRDSQREEEQTDEEISFGSEVRQITFGHTGFKHGGKIRGENTVDSTSHSPVFPVSDARGYEVYGSYRYGRGLAISGSNSLEQIAFADPFQFASPSDVDDYIRALQGNKVRETSFEVTEKDGTKRTVNSGEFRDARDFTEARLLEAIKMNPETPQGLIEFLGDNSQFSNGLGNWIASSKDYTQKLTLENAAFNLSDLNVHSIKNESCTCRSRSASVALEAFSQDGFVEILPADADEITKFLANQTQIIAGPWNATQKILRGD